MVGVRDSYQRAAIGALGVEDASQETLSPFHRGKVWKGDGPPDRGYVRLTVAYDSVELLPIAGCSLEDILLCGYTEFREKSAGSVECLRVGQAEPEHVNPPEPLGPGLVHARADVSVAMDHATEVSPPVL